MKHSSRGYLHHADWTTECPGCGRRHRTGTSVTERPDGSFGVIFKSKQTGRWGHIVVPGEAVEWSDRHPMAETEPEPDQVVALVTVDEQGRLTAESTVTVGEFTWPVPERTEGGGIIGTARIQAALREHGYTMLPGRHGSSTQPGVYEVPVKPVEDS